MWPQLRDGERVVLEVPPRRQPQRGEIVLLKQANGFILHRIIAGWRQAGQQSYLTRGDNSIGADHQICSTEVIGRLIAVKRQGKTINFDSGFRRTLGFCLGYLSYVELQLLNTAIDLRRKLRHMLGTGAPGN